MSEISFHFFGPVRVTHPVHGELPFKIRKVVALLAYLTLGSDRAHSRDKLMGLFWSDLPEKAARNNLRVALTRATKGLGENAVPWLVSDRQTVQFNPEADIWLDVRVFEQALQTTKRHVHKDRARCPGCCETLQTVADLYGGDFLEGFYLEGCYAFEEWQFSVRERLQLEAVNAFADVADYLESQGEVAKAEDYTRRQLGLEPLREDAHRRLMRLLSYQGKRSAAVEHFERYQEQLQTELSIEPEDETVALYHQIQSGVFESHSANTVVETQATPTNLAPNITPFIGREKELEQLRAHLQSQRLITLLGIGGTGKTRLALALAKSHLRAFKDGIYLINLAPLQNVSDVIAAVAEALGFALRQESDTQAQLLKHLEKMSVLLVFDNFEHLLAGRTFISNILERTTTPKLLVTSRQKLGVMGEAVYPVSGLSYPKKSGAFTLEPTYSAVDLFLDTAKRVRLDFEASQEDRVHVHKICQLVEGHPLALVLAAGWLESLTCEAIAQEVSQGIELLATDMQGVPERQKSVHAVFTYSWQLLSQKEQSSFASLSVFKDGFERSAAREVANASLRQLTNLVGKSFIQYVPESNRYEIHELLRQFAEAKLAEMDHSHAVRNAHSDHYLSLLMGLEEGFQIGSQEDALQSFSHEFENIRTAWHWANGQAKLEKMAASVSALSSFYALQGRENDLVDLLEPTLALVSEDGEANRIVELKVLLALGGAYRSIRGYAAPELPSIFERAYALSLESETSLELFPILFGLWSFNIVQGNYQQTLDIVAQWNERVASADRNASYLEDAALVVLILEGTTRHVLGDFSSAAKLLERGLALDKSERHQTLIASYGLNHAVTGRVWLAMTYGLQGYLDKALSVAYEAKTIAKKHAHPFTTAFAAWGMASLRFLRGDYKPVMKNAKEMREVARTHKLSWFANHAAMFEGFVQSFEHAREGIALMETTLDDGGGLEVHEDFYSLLLIEAHLRAKQLEPALTRTETILGFVQTIGLEKYKAELLRLQGQVYWQQGLVTESEHHFRQAIMMSKKQEAKVLELRATSSYSRFLAEQGKPDEAKSMLSKIYDWFTEGFDTTDLKEARLLLESLETAKQA